MGIQVRGNLSGSRKPYLDPRVAYELSKINKAIPKVSFGTSFPTGSIVGDEHFFTGEDTTEFKKNNWYKRTSIATWQSMNATSVLGENLSGTIPSGVKIADYLSLFGGTMEGDIEFSDTQKFAAESIEKGTIQSGVKILDYIPKTGGQFIGSLDMSDKNIGSIGFLYGLDTDLSIDMSQDGIIEIAADTEIILTSALLTLNIVTAVSLNVGTIVATSITGTTLHITDDITLDDDMTLAAGSVLTWATDTNLYRSAADTLKTDDTLIAANIAAGANINQDVRSGAAPTLLGTNFQAYNIVCDDDEVIVSDGEVVYA